MKNKEQFTGYIEITPPLNKKEIEYLKNFSSSKRMDRRKGPYFISESNDLNHPSNADVLEGDIPPTSQPGLWCKWTPTDDGTKLQWNEYNNFYNPKEWMKYLIIHFLGTEPVAKLVHGDEFDFLEGHTLNGIIYYTKSLEGNDKPLDNNFCSDENNCLIVVNDNKVNLTTSLEELKKKETLKIQKKLEQQAHNEILDEISLALKNKIEVKATYKEAEIVLSFNDAIKKKYPLFTNIWNQPISNS